MEDAISMSFQNFLWMRRSPRALIAKGCFISSHEELVKDTSRALGAEKPGAKKLAPGAPVDIKGEDAARHTGGKTILPV
jgi:hypothetical protein